MRRKDPARVASNGKSLYASGGKYLGTHGRLVYNSRFGPAKRIIETGNNFKVSYIPWNRPAEP